jgi:hypothetical protein
MKTHSRKPTPGNFTPKPFLLVKEEEGPACQGFSINLELLFRLIGSKNEPNQTQTAWFQQGIGIGIRIWIRIVVMQMAF